MNWSLNNEDPVWYVAYGSNMSAARFTCYLSGGRPRGGRRTYTGARNQSPPRRDSAIRLPGGLVFAGESTVWGGGIAFYDTHAEGELAARAYLLTFGQLSDVVAQEGRRPVGTDLTLDHPAGRRWVLPSQAYETLLHVGERDAVPMLTITSGVQLVPTAPSAAYLRTVLAGLGETFGWNVEQRVDYLVRARGVVPTWTADALAGLCAE
ncbi:hypothetical protein BH11ACT6_BH11ACT6_57740 [soil metagenome]